MRWCWRWVSCRSQVSFMHIDTLWVYSSCVFLFIIHVHCNSQSSQNVPTAGHLVAYNEISATYFMLVRLVFRTEALPASASAAYYYSQLAYYSKTFDWAAISIKKFSQYFQTRRTKSSLQFAWCPALHETPVSRVKPINGSKMSLESPNIQVNVTL